MRAADLSADLAMVAAECRDSRNRFAASVTELMWRARGGLLRRYQGHLDEAAGSFARAQQLFSARGERFGQATALCGHGDILLGQSRFEAATAVLTQALQIFRELGKQGGEASAMAGLGEAYGRHDDWEQAIIWSGGSVGWFPRPHIGLSAHGRPNGGSITGLPSSPNGLRGYDGAFSE